MLLGRPLRSSLQTSRDKGGNYNWLCKAQPGADLSTCCGTQNFRTMVTFYTFMFCACALTTAVATTYSKKISGASNRASTSQAFKRFQIIYLSVYFAMVVRGTLMIAPSIESSIRLERASHLHHPLRSFLPLLCPTPFS